MRTSASLLLTLLVSACTQEPAPQASADVVILGAAIDTVNPAQARASALAIRNGKIAYVGDDTHAQSWIGPKTRVVKLQGASVWPGLIDSHIHLMEGALTLEDCSFADVQLTLAQAEPIIHDCAARKPTDAWLLIQNLNAADFHADRKALDAIVRDRPLFLYSTDGHVAWVNSVALARAGIDRKTPDPGRGRIERDRQGEPTGFLVDSAVGLVSDHFEKPSPERRERLLLSALHELAAAGITSFMEANTSAETVRTYVEIARKNQLHARVSMALASEGENTDEEFKRLKALRTLAESQPPLRANLIKLFNDGVLEFPTQSAAMLDPYLDAKGRPTKNRGPLYHEAGPLSEFVQRADKEGFGVHIHAIGDRAVRVALDAFADARGNGSKRPYSIAHLELIDPRDIPRFRELNVVASLQLLWAQPDNYSVDAVLPYIGPERHSRLYPAHSLIEGGATVAGGSDWNVSSFNPFEATAVAVSRINPTHPERGVLDPEQRVTLRDMLLAYTLNAAHLMGRDSETGSLEVGKSADVIVLDRTLNDASTAADIRATKIVYTFANGTMQIGPN